MQATIISVLAALASSLAAGLAYVKYRGMAKEFDRAEITVVNTRTGKTATLPRNYNPTAVEQLLELAK